MYEVKGNTYWVYIDIYVYVCACEYVCIYNICTSIYVFMYMYVDICYNVCMWILVRGY